MVIAEKLNLVKGELKRMMKHYCSLFLYLQVPQKELGRGRVKMKERDVLTEC